MGLVNSLRTAVLVTTAGLISTGLQAGPLPTNVASMKSMIDQNTIEIRWRGGYGYRGVSYRGGGWGYRGWGYRGRGYGLAAGAIVGGAIASRSYYGGYYGGYPSYSYASVPSYGYGGYGHGYEYCPPYSG